MTAPNQSPTTAGATGLAIWRAAMYRALSAAFSYPDADSLEQLTVDLEELCDHPLTAEWKLLPATAALFEAVRGTDAETQGARHNELFGGEVPCSPYETEYEFDAFAKARQLADIAGFYAAFGLKAAGDDEAAPADFVATELEFLSHLALKVAFAGAQGWDDRAEVAMDASRNFLEDHPGQWLPLFCRTVAGLDDIDSLYGAAACLCDAFLNQEIELLGAKPRPAMVRRASRVIEEEFICPMAGPVVDQEEDLA